MLIRMIPSAPAEEPCRSVSAHLQVEVLGQATIVFLLAVASHYETSSESFTATLDGEPVVIEEIKASHNGRLHCVRDVRPGWLIVNYKAEVAGVAAAPPISDDEWIRYIRPSRYCETDRFGPFVRDEFAGLRGAEFVAAVSNWVGANIIYVPGSSRSTDGAVATLLAREGVCRDFAHLTAALLRAGDIPARIVGVYAPGLFPMDFHAVVEAYLDGVWIVVDPTRMAPRRAMVRIATGADAADIAFVTNIGGAIRLTYLEVGAFSWPGLPHDDMAALVELN